MKAYALALLQETNNLKQVVRAWIPRRSEHTHQALRRNVRGLGSSVKPTVALM